MNPSTKAAWIARLIRRLFGIDEALEELRSMNARLEKLEKCVRPSVKHKPWTSHIVTGHWND